MGHKKLDIRNSPEISRKLPQSVKERNAWQTNGIRFGSVSRDLGFFKPTDTEPSFLRGKATGT